MHACIISLYTRTPYLRSWRWRSMRGHRALGVTRTHTHARTHTGMTQDLWRDGKRHGKHCFRLSPHSDIAFDKLAKRECPAPHDETKLPKPDQDPTAAPQAQTAGTPRRGALYECVRVPGYEVGQGTELAPAPRCLSGTYSWGVCLEGRFLCELACQQMWDRNLSQWQSARDSLEAANRHLFEAFGSDTEPEKAFRYPNLLALRSAKLRDWLRRSEDLDFSAHLSCRDLYHSPHEQLTRLQKAFALRIHPRAQDPARASESRAPGGWTSDWNLDGHCVLEFGECIDSSWRWMDSEAKAKRDTFLKGKHMAPFDEQAPMHQATPLYTLSLVHLS